MINKMENINDVTMEKNYTVYMHVCPNGKVYIGITGQNPKKRWLNGKGYINNIYFYRAIQKYGWKNILHIVIENNLTLDDANKMEIELIAKFKSTDINYGYNIQNGGNGIGKHSIDTIKKITDKCKFSKKTHCNGIIFNSLTECANYYGIKNHTMESWVNNKNPMYSEFKEMNLRYATEKDLNECEKYDTSKHGDKANIVIVKEYARKVHCNGIIFNSIVECANYYSIKKDTFSPWVRDSHKIPLKFKEMNLRYATEKDLNECEKYDTSKHGDKANIVIGDNKRKFIHCDNLIFKSITECANYYDINRGTMESWLKGQNPTHSEFKEMNLRYATNEDLNKYEKYDSKKHGDKANIVINIINKGEKKIIHCDGIIFNTITECANYYGTSKNNITRWLNGKRTMPVNFQQLGLRYATNEDLNTYPRYTPVNN